MNTRKLSAFGAALLLARGASVDAQSAPPAPSEPGVAAAGPAAATEDEPPPPSAAELDQRLRRTEELVLNSRPTFNWGGYIDLGFFAAQGDGTGYVQDFGHARFPAYRERFGWVFLGDVLAPAVNSRGEPADLGEAPGVERFDSVNSRGAPGFMFNEANFTVRSALAPTAIVTASFNLVPRTGNDFRFGDVFDVDVGQLEWLPTESQRTSIFVGKMDSVIGIEYRTRKANKRFGITPSLLARYTTGTALGLKVRSKFGARDWFVLAGALTNGSNMIEPFHFYDEVDSNAGKTLSGRASVRIPFLGGVELGMSGSWGPQDRALASRDDMWLVGPDLIAQLGPVEVQAQYLRGGAPGQEQGGVYGLELHGGAYLELNVRLGASLGVLLRGEYRDAFVWLGSERAYLTKSWRGTAGLRWTFVERAAVKAEYLRNGEYGALPAVANDVFVGSLVLAY